MKVERWTVEKSVLINTVEVLIFFEIIPGILKDKDFENINFEEKVNWEIKTLFYTKVL